MYNQLYQHFDDSIFPGQCGFRQEHITQHLGLIEKVKTVDMGSDFRALLTNLL